MPSIYLGVQKQKKPTQPLQIFKIKTLSASNMCVDLAFNPILTVTFFKTCLFTSLVLGDCQTLPDNCYCICEAVLVSQSLQVWFRWPFFFHSDLFLLDLSSALKTAFKITGQICSEYLKVPKNLNPRLLAARNGVLSKRLIHTAAGTSCIFPSHFGELKSKPTVCIALWMPNKQIWQPLMQAWSSCLIWGFLPLQLADAEFQHGDFWAAFPEALNSPRALLRSLLPICL